MESKKLRVCEINHGSHFSLCELHQDDLNNYFISVSEDPEGLFTGFKISIKEASKEKEAIKTFEKECLNRFTCNGEFSLDYIKKESGELIRFY